MPKMSLEEAELIMSMGFRYWDSIRPRVRPAADCLPRVAGGWARPTLLPPLPGWSGRGLEES